ncbi:hypothetical protein [Luteolibacter sp. AS25]|uniref:hypothetical protein n=1 Tax=Luteolibacter sp. AS25 TaxID=3135776 RepID=UPI00398B33A1
MGSEKAGDSACPGLVEKVGNCARGVDFQTAMAEGSGAVAKRLGAMAERLGAVATRLGAMAERLGAMAEGLGAMAEGLGAGDWASVSGEQVSGAVGHRRVHHAILRKTGARKKALSEIQYALPTRPQRINTAMLRSSITSKLVALSVLLAVFTGMISAAEYESEILVIQTDLALAATIRAAAENGEISTEKFDGILDDLVSKNRVEEIYREAREIPDEWFLEFVHKVGEATELSDEPVDLGYTLSTQLTLNKEKNLIATIFGGRIFLRTSRDLFVEKDISSSTETPLDRWQILGEWSEPESSMLVLNQVRSLSATKTEPGKPSFYKVKVELLETAAADLDKFKLAGPENRAKALAWLRDRGTFLHRTELDLGREWGLAKNIVADYKGSEEYLGYEMVFRLHQVSTESDAITVSIEGFLNASGKRRESADYLLDSIHTLRNGETGILETDGKSTGGNKRIIMLATPSIGRARVTPAIQFDAPIRDGESTVYHRIPMGFMEEMHKALPKPPVNSHPRPVQQLLGYLEEKGLPVDEDMRSIFQIYDNYFSLTATAEAQKAVRKYFQEWGN